MENNKIKKDINNVVNDNLKALEQLFPSAVKDGQLDIKVLKEELGDFEEVGNEKYELNWSGKQNAKKMVQQGIGNKTLKFVEKDSKNADSTENIYIEGDNLEVLKLLRQNYYNSIKMIYIDPPYNTGNDFVYNDTFKMDKEESDKAEGIISENNEKLQKNQKSTNRYHANWLNMMYPRLKLARDLLTDDGVIFISIDDNEQANLKRLCDEIFGEENFVADIIWNSTKSVTNTALISVSHTHNLVYFKNINYYIKNREKFRLPDDGEGFSNPDNDPRGAWKADPFQVGGWRPNQQYEIVNSKTGIVYKPNSGCSWKNDLKKYEELLKDNRIVFGKNGESGPQRKRFIWEAKERGKVVKTLWNDIETTTNGTQLLKKIFNGKSIFDNPKPVELLTRILNLSTSSKEHNIILDFFSGSATTAHAVMQLNSEDNGNRKYIMVQLPETTDEKSEAFKAGYKNIAEIGKERIRRAGEKIKQEIEEYNSNLKLGEEPKEVLDIGFKVFKVDDTNIKWYDLENFNEESQYSFDDPDSLDFVLGSNDIDIVYEIMLRQNDVPLSESLEVLTDIGNRTYLYASTYLICLEIEITEEMVEKLASLEPLPIKFIFRDSAFKDNISF